MLRRPLESTEDARRPTRERECLVGERTRIVNRIKAALARLGVRGFKPTLRNALQQLDALRTPEGTALPPNTRAELHRDMARLQFVTEQIQQIEAARSHRLEQASADGPNAMVRLLAQVVGVGRETADMLVHEVLSRNLRDRRAVARYAGLTGSPDESGSKRREKGLAKAGNARVRRGAAGDDPAGLALSAASEGECVGSVVSGAHGGCSGQHAQDPDCGAGAKAADCAVADGDHRRSPARRCLAARSLRRPGSDYSNSIRASFTRDSGTR